MKRNFKKLRTGSFFTLVELLVSMGVFTLLMFVLIRFFDSAQKAWTLSSQRNMVYENARIALDLITRDLQCALYNDDNSVKGIYPFWHEDTNKINFITSTNISPPDKIILGTPVPAVSKVCEVKYARTDGTLTADELTGSGMAAGWLVRSVTGDNSVDYDIPNPNDATDPDNKYNFHLFPRSSGDSQRVYKIWKDVNPPSNWPSSEDFRTVIPYVVSIVFTCYTSDGLDMSATNAGANNDYGDWGIAWPNTGTGAVPTPFPYSIKVDLTLLDKVSWDKWVEFDSDHDADPSDDSTHAWGSGTLEDFRKQNERTFSKTIFLGERASN